MYSQVQAIYDNTESCLLESSNTQRVVVLRQKYDTPVYNFTQKKKKQSKLETTLPSDFKIRSRSLPDLPTISTSTFKNCQNKISNSSTPNPFHPARSTTTFEAKYFLESNTNNHYDSNTPKLKGSSDIYESLWDSDSEYETPQRVSHQLRKAIQMEITASKEGGAAVNILQLQPVGSSTYCNASEKSLTLEPIRRSQTLPDNEIISLKSSKKKRNHSIKQPLSDIRLQSAATVVIVATPSPSSAPELMQHYNQRDSYLPQRASAVCTLHSPLDSVCETEVNFIKIPSRSASSDAILLSNSDSITDSRSLTIPSTKRRKSVPAFLGIKSSNNSRSSTTSTSASNTKISASPPFPKPLYSEFNDEQQYKSNFAKKRLSFGTKSVFKSVLGVF